MDKFEQTVALLSELIAANKRLLDFKSRVNVENFHGIECYLPKTQASPDYVMFRELSQAIFDKGDELFFFMMEQFPLRNRNEAREQYLVPWRAKVDILSADVLRSIPEQVVPLVVGLLSISIHKIAYDTTRMKSFDLFAAMYVNVVMQETV